MKTTNTNDNESKAKASESYKKVIAAIVAGGMIKENLINPSLINFMPEEKDGTYYINYNYMSCNARIPIADVDPLDRELCKSAFGGWSIWGTYEAHV